MKIHTRREISGQFYYIINNTSSVLKIFMMAEEETTLQRENIVLDINQRVEFSSPPKNENVFVTDKKNRNLKMFIFIFDYLL